MCLSKNNCPVPFDQQPLNEFYALQESGLFAFFGLKSQSYISALFYVVLILILISILLSANLFFYHWVQGLILDVLFMTFILSLILMRLYLGWSYIVARLFSATIFYEESGWYDGQMWIKTPEMLTKDRLIGTYYVMPVLERIQSTFLFLFGLLLFQSFIYYLLC